MTSQWQYQVRFDVTDSAKSESVRRKLADPEVAQLFVILAKHRAVPKCQFDAFAEYVAVAEEQGVESYPLYQWTKATIENQEKREKYLKSLRSTWTTERFMPRKLPTRSRQTCNRSRLTDSLREYPSTIQIPPTILSRRTIPASGANRLFLSPPTLQLAHHVSFFRLWRLAILATCP